MNCAEEDMPSSPYPTPTKHGQKHHNRVPLYNNCSLKRHRCEQATSVLRIHHTWLSSMRFRHLRSLLDFWLVPNWLNANFLYPTLLIRLVSIPHKKIRPKEPGVLARRVNFSDPGIFRIQALTLYIIYHTQLILSLSSWIIHTCFPGSSRPVPYLPSLCYLLPLLYHTLLFFTLIKTCSYHDLIRHTQDPNNRTATVALKPYVVTKVNKSNQIEE